MTIVDMLGQSLILTLLGMGVVFAFLIILIIALGLVRNLLRVLKLDEDAPTASAGASAAAPAAVQPAASNQNDAVVAAIAAALHEKKV